MSAKPGVSNYAPKVFSRHGKSAGMKVKQFESAMERLLERGEIVNVPFGKPSANQWKLATAETAAAMQAEPAKGRPDAEAIALTALEQTIVAHGVDGMVTVEQWRDAAYTSGISEGGDRARQIAFKKARKALIDSLEIVEHDGGRVGRGIIE